MHCLSHMGVTEYKTDKDKFKLLKQTIDAICNNMKVLLDYIVPQTTRDFFSSLDFSEFKTKIDFSEFKTKKKDSDCT